MADVRCRVSAKFCKKINIYYYITKEYNVVELLGGGSVINGATQYSLDIQTFLSSVVRVGCF